MSLKPQKINPFPFTHYKTIAMILSVVLVVGLGVFVVWRAQDQQLATDGLQDVLEVRAYEALTAAPSNLTSEDISVRSMTSAWKLPAVNVQAQRSPAELAAEKARAAQAAAARAFSNQALSGLMGGGTTNLGKSRWSNGNHTPAPGNTYYGGYCTWYAYNRRYEIGKVVSTHLGNGGSWGRNARAQGYSVDGNPRIGDVIVMPETSRAGHVAIVEQVGDGMVYISEMNVGGLWHYNERWVKIGSHQFVH